FLRDAEVDAKAIHVEADGGRVLLSGSVRSWAERKAAEDTARRTPGVTTVENRIVISVTSQGAPS
ncbi:MAG: hypothetical protein JWQ89_2032, partial [Devosia sp.]|uniref:BON domain-containing protein n=1 Tax=Devosia sp. TaxID=1871048 RepID=UPI002608D0B8